YLREATATLFFTMFVYHLLRFGLLKDIGLSALAALVLSSTMAALLHGAFVLLPVFAFLCMVAKMANNRWDRNSAVVYSLGVCGVFATVIAFFSLGVGASKAGVLYSSSFEAASSGVLRAISSGMM